MIRRPLVLALALALSPAAFAQDLLQTYELARNSDPQLAAAEAGRLATREGAVQARADLLPQIGGEASLTRSRNDGSSIQQQFVNDASGQEQLVTFNVESETETTSRDLGVNLQQAIYDRSRIKRLKSQQALSRAADFQLESAGDSLITRTSAAYFSVLVAIETLAAAQAQEEALKKQFDFASKRLEVGLAPITDVHEARAQYDGARANTIVTRNALEDAYQALAEITGTPVRNLKGLPEDFQPTLPTEQDIDGWIAAALDSNPALKAAEFQVQSAAADVETARAARWPTLYLNGGYGDQKVWGDRTTRTIDGEPRTFPADSEGRGPQLGIALSVPIFTGGRISSQVRQAVATRDVRQQEYEQQKRALERNTRNAYQTLIAGISEVEARKAAVFSARSAYEASQVGLEVGTRTVLDVLVNQQTLFDAEREYALARYNFLQNRLLLEQAAGTVGVDSLQDINRLLTVDAEAELAPGTLQQ